MKTFVILLTFCCTSLFAFAQTDHSANNYKHPNKANNAAKTQKQNTVTYTGKAVATPYKMQDYPLINQGAVVHTTTNQNHYKHPKPQTPNPDTKAKDTPSPETVVAKQE